MLCDYTLCKNEYLLHNCRIGMCIKRRESVVCEPEFSWVDTHLEGLSEEVPFFLGASKHLCKRVCPSVRPSVGPLRLHIFGGFDVLKSTAWPVWPLVFIVIVRTIASQLETQN